MADNSPVHGRRQRTLVFSGIAILAIYMTLQFGPESIRNLFALTAVPILILTLFFFIGSTRLRGSGIRKVYLIAPFLVAVMVVIVLLPDLRRAGLRNRLQSLGARVTLDFEQRYSFLPRWFKQESDWAALGRIKQIDFANGPVPVAKLGSLEFDETIWFLNLEGSDVSHADLEQIGSMLDAEIVSLSRTPADAATLQVFGRMPSLRRIYAVQTAVSDSDATAFRLQHPTVELVVYVMTGKGAKRSGPSPP